MIPRRRSGLLGRELLGVAADARERRLEVVADAAQEVVLRRVELDEPAVLGLDLGEQLGVADRDRDLAREQLEQVLVGALPAPRRRQVPDEHAEVLARRPRSSARTGTGSPGTTSSIGISRGSTSSTPAVDHPERARRARRRRGARGTRAARRGVIDSIASRIRPSSSFRRCEIARRGGCGSRRGGRARRRPAARAASTRSPAETRSTAARDRPQRRARSAARSGGEEDARDDRDGDREQQDARDAVESASLAGVRDEEHDDAEAGERAGPRRRSGRASGGSGTRASREVAVRTGALGSAAASAMRLGTRPRPAPRSCGGRCRRPPSASRSDSHRGSVTRRPAGRPRPGGSRSRGPSGGGPACSGRARPSGGAGAS